METLTRRHVLWRLIWICMLAYVPQKGRLISLLHAKLFWGFLHNLRFQIILSKILQSVKQFGSRSVPTFSLGTKLFHGLSAESKIVTKHLKDFKTALFFSFVCLFFVVFVVFFFFFFCFVYCLKSVKWGHSLLGCRRSVILLTIKRG